MESEPYLVFSRDITEIVKKKYFTSQKDKKDWIDFTKKMSGILPKDIDSPEDNIEIGKVKKLDLHGFSLDEANKLVKNFIIKSYNSGLRKIIIITGKGLRSKSHLNPYLSEKLSVLRHSIPEYIKKDKNLNDKIMDISIAEKQDGGEGAICIFLKKILKNKF